MKLYQFIFCFFSIFGVFISCNTSEKQNTKIGKDSLQEYKYFTLREQGWKSKRANQFVNDINYTAIEVPLEYYFLKSTNGDYNKADFLFHLNAKERVIEVEFQHINQVDLLLNKYTNKSYEDAVKYMAFTIEKDFTVVTTSNDTIACSGVNFERNFKVAPFKRLLLYFNDISPNDNIKLIYQDHLFGNGIIKFNFNQIPLKL